MGHQAPSPTQPPRNLRPTEVGYIYGPDVGVVYGLVSGLGVIINLIREC